MTSQTAANIATVVTALAAIAALGVAVLAARFARNQFLEQSQSRGLSAFIAILNSLQDERVREARRTLINLQRDGRKIESWTPEEVAKADLALRNYNTLAIMIEARLLPANMERAALDEWGGSLLQCWEAGQPLVEKYRAERRDHSYWPRLHTLYNRVKESRC